MRTDLEPQMIYMPNGEIALDTDPIILIHPSIEGAVRDAYAFVFASVGMYQICRVQLRGEIGYIYGNRIVIDEDGIRDMKSLKDEITRALGTR